MSVQSVCKRPTPLPQKRTHSRTHSCTHTHAHTCNDKPFKCLRRVVATTPSRRLNGFLRRKSSALQSSTRNRLPHRREDFSPFLQAAECPIMPADCATSDLVNLSDSTP